jgi:hypothetical protein
VADGINEPWDTVKKNNRPAPPDLSSHNEHARHTDNLHRKENPGPGCVTHIEPALGIEPRTTALQVRSSTTELNGRSKLITITRDPLHGRHPKLFLFQEYRK